MLTSQEVVLSAADVQFDARWGMMQTETREPPLLDLAARLRTSYASNCDSPSVSTHSMANRRRHIEVAVGVSAPSIGCTPIEIDTMA